MTDTVYTPNQVQRLLAERQRGWRDNSDLEQALRALPFCDVQILFMTVCMGSWRNGAKPDEWQEQVADWWGIGAGQVNKVVNEALETVCDSLNSFAVDNG